MRVLLVSPNRERLPDPVVPIGLAYVASALVRSGHEVRVLDLLFSDDFVLDAGAVIRDFRPDVVGMSIRNIDDVTFPRRHSYIDEYKEAVDAVRRFTRAPLVLGGSGFTIMPREFMRALGADYGIAGEGEEAFPALLEEMGGARRLVPGRRIRDLDAIRPSSGLFDLGSYYSLGGMLSVQTKRGCNLKCIYCTYPKVEGRRIRQRSPGKVADELEALVRETGVRHFFIVDSVFNNPPAHAEAVCREIITRGLDISWTCYCTPRGLDERLVGLMRRAGCTGVEFGTDSLSDELIGRLGKGFTFRQVSEVSAACRREGMKFCHFIFIGAPGQTARDASEGFERLDSLGPDAAVIMAGIRVFPGTVLEKISGMGRPGLEPVFYIEPSVLEAIERLSEEVSQRRNWIMPGFEINIYGRLQRRLRESGIKGPLWEGLTQRWGR